MRWASYGNSAALVSRTITANVPAGRLRILLTVSLDDTSPRLTPTVSAGSVHFSNGFIDNFYVRAALAQVAGGHSAAFSSALDRLVEDSRLISR